MNMKTYLWFAIPAFIFGMAVPIVLGETGGQMTGKEVIICVITTVVSLGTIALGGYLQIRKELKG